MSLRRQLSRGDHLIWFTGSALGACLLMIAGLVAIVLVNGLGFFWPKPLVRLTLKDGSLLLGEVVQREAIPNPGHPDHLKRQRLQLRTGNRDLLGIDFKWVDEDQILRSETPAEAWFVERREYGPLLAVPVAVRQGDKIVAGDPAAAAQALPPLVSQAHEDRAAVRRLEKDEIGAVNFEIERARQLGATIPIPQETIDRLYDRYQNVYGQHDED